MLVAETCWKHAETTESLAVLLSWHGLHQNHQAAWNPWNPWDKSQSTWDITGSQSQPLVDQFQAMATAAPPADQLPHSSSLSSSASDKPHYWHLALTSPRRSP